MNKRIFFSTTGLLLTAAAFILVNLLASRLLPSQQLDLTQQRIYSLSQPSLQLLQEMTQPVELSLYFSAKAARQLPHVRRHARQVSELLRQYERLANGKIRLQLLEPEPFSSLEDQAGQLGLQPLLLPSGEQLFLGLAGSNQQGATDSIAFFALEQEQLLEYQISRLLQRLQQPEQVRVALLSSLDLLGEFDAVSGTTSAAWQLAGEVRQQYKIQRLPRHTDHIAPNTDLLWLVQPQNLPRATLYAIEQFVLRGGKLLLFIDPFSEQLPAASLAANELAARSADLPELLQAWGVRLRPASLVGDLRYAMPVSVPQHQMPVQHLAWLNIDRSGLNQQHSITAGLHNISLASAGIIEPLEQAQTTVTALLQSSDNAMPYASKRLLGLRDPGELLADMQPTGERYLIAARINGPAQSIFPDGVEGQPPPVLQADNIDIIVVADTDLLHDSMWLHSGNQPWADNASFVLNALDSLGGGQSLANIRSQVQYSRPFTLVERLRRQARQKLASQQQLLMQQLQQTERQLAQLRQQDEHQPGSRAQQQTLEQFSQQRLHIRQQLRDIQYQLNADIEKLGMRIKLFNIILMPFVLCFAILLFVMYRRHHHEARDVA